MRLCGNDGRSTAIERIYNSHLQKLFAVYLVVTLEKSIATAIRVNVDEVIKIIHRREFRLAVLKILVKNSRNCEYITEEVINKKKEFYL